MRKRLTDKDFSKEIELAYHSVVDADESEIQFCHVKDNEDSLHLKYKIIFYFREDNIYNFENTISKYFKDLIKAKNLNIENIDQFVNDIILYGSYTTETLTIFTEFDLAIVESNNEIDWEEISDNNISNIEFKIESHNVSFTFDFDEVDNDEFLDILPENFIEEIEELCVENSDENDYADFIKEQIVECVFDYNTGTIAGLIQNKE